MFSNRMLRKICGPKKERVNGGWIKLNNKELYPSLNINVKETLIRKIKWAGNVIYLGVTRYTKDFLEES
jgi:hypothetical protein